MGRSDAPPASSKPRRPQPGGTWESRARNSSTRFATTRSGGSNVAVSTFSKNQAGALAMIDFMTSDSWQEQIAVKNALAPAVTAAYASEPVKKALPFSQELLKALTSAKARPVSPVYPQISQAIYQAVGKVLSGELTPQAGASQMADKVGAALKTF